MSSPARCSRQHHGGRSLRTTRSPCSIPSSPRPAGGRRTCAATTARSSPRTRCETGAASPARTRRSSSLGAPWQNGHCESFNSRFRDELLIIEQFDEHNSIRPHGLDFTRRGEVQDNPPPRPDRLSAGASGGGCVWRPDPRNPGHLPVCRCASDGCLGRARVRRTAPLAAPPQPALAPAHCQSTKPRRGRR